MEGGSHIEHVVVLMLENHSFDHLLGFLNHPKAEEFDGLTPGRFHNIDDAGTPVAVSDDGLAFGLDPDHTHMGALEQIGAAGDVATNGGFVRNYEVEAPGDGALIMRCLDPAVHCTALATLAVEFAVCTAWFSSVPGETWPNRNFAHAATSNGTVLIEGGLYYDRTIFERLAKNKDTWRIYYEGTPEVWCYPRLWKPTTFVDFLLRRRARIGNWFESAQFADHASKGDLATYTFIEPAHNKAFGVRQTNSQHPHNNVEGDADFQAGEALIASVYESLRANPELFAKTLLVITYDEHGGLYDHVSPPPATPPGGRAWRGIVRRIWGLVRAKEDRKAGRKATTRFDFKRLGVRVPTVLVSPWIEPGTIVSETLEHASIPATLRALFAPASKPLTDRDRDANTFHQVVTGSSLDGPRPNPGAPNPANRPPMPDLSAEAQGGHADAPVADTAAPGQVAAANDLDRGLLVVAGKVDRKLRRHPTTAVAKRRAAKLGSDDALAAPNGEIFDATEQETVSLFRASAKTARRRPVTRPPGP